MNWISQAVLARCWAGLRWAWYGLVSWIECSFKDFKRGGLGWHHEKMQDAGRVEWLWLAMVWMVRLGMQAEKQLPGSLLGASAWKAGIYNNTARLS